MNYQPTPTTTSTEALRVGKSHHTPSGGLIGILIPILALAGCLLAGTPTHAQAPNILILLIDDLGIEHVEPWGVGADFAPTPNINSLAENGIRFDNAWANPVCSPSRASLMTGRHPFRTQVGWLLGNLSAVGLRANETTLAELLQPAGYTSGAFGKWQLGLSLAGRDTPRIHGFDHFEGILLAEQTEDQYFSWMKTTNGVRADAPESGYLTSAVFDWVLDWTAAQEQPWLAWVGIRSVHKPFHCPPEELRPETACPPEASAEVQYRAMIEALDTEIGRLMESINLDDTLVILASDNGSPENVAEWPYDADHAKSTVFEGGVRVPMVLIGGPVSTSGVVTDPVQLTDIFATLATEVGLPSEAEDSFSLRPYFTDVTAEPVRQFNYTEGFGPYGGRPEFGQVAARNDRYKLIVELDGNKFFFDLLANPDECCDLMEQPELSATEQEAYDQLMSYIIDLHR